MKCKVYVLKDPTTDEIRYVGITTRTLEQRLRGHLRDVIARPDLNYHKIAWIKHLQKGGLIPKIEQIDEFDTIEEAKEAEVDYIAKYKDQYRLTNGTAGGDHMGFRVYDREVVLKRKNIKAVVQYNIFGEKIAEYPITEDAVRAEGLSSGSKITMCCKGKRKHAHGYIWRYKGDQLGDISDINKNSLYFCNVVQYDMKGNKIAEYDSYKEASKVVDEKSKGGQIAAAATGGQKTCKGFIWKLEYKLKRGSL
jgi:hypothetical protein